MSTGRRPIWVAVAWSLLLLVAPGYAEICKLVVDGPIHPISEEFIARGLASAAQRKSEAVLIELRTPGGLSDSTRNIIQSIVSSPVPVIIFVAPGGARAASAGFFILEAADVAAMAPGTNTGAAHPVNPGGGDIGGTMGQKIENDSAALMRSVAGKRGRNVEAAESAVRQSKSFTDQEALEKKLIEIVAPNESELLQKLDGRTIQRWDGSKVTLHLAGKRIEPFEMTLKQRILNALMDPNLSFLLLVLGIFAVYVEFNHPGLVVPGVLGVFCIVLSVFALNILPVRFAALGLILLAFVFFILEAKFTSYGALTVAGISSLVLGALLLVDGPIPQMRVQLLTALSVSIPLGIITTFLMTIALRAHRAKVLTGIEGLIGELGVARTPVAESGKVFVHGELWDAVSATPIATGEAIRVRGMLDFHLEVEPVVQGTALPSAGPPK